MPFNGSGVFSLASPQAPFVTGTAISATDMNTVQTDIATNGLTNCVTRDGQSPLTANWNVGNFNITGIGTLSATSLTLSTSFSVGTSLSVGTTLAVGTAATVGTTLVIGSATGGAQGAGTINATGVYDDGVLLKSTFPWSTTLNWSQSSVVVNGTVIFTGYAPFAGTVDALTYNVGSAGGSFICNVKIGTTSITGLSAVTVNSSTTASTNASGANTFAAGDKIEVAITSTSGSPTGSFLVLRGTRS